GRPGGGVLAAGGGLLAGAALAGLQIYRYHGGEQSDAAWLAAATDPLTGKMAGGEDTPQRLPLPPVAKSLLMGAAVSAGLHGVAVAEGAFARGAAAGIRRVAPGAGPLAGLAGPPPALRAAPGGRGGP